jgi:hypothetical protein
MQDIFKRYFWVLGAAVVLVCSIFAAKATSHVVEAKFLGDSSKTPKVRAVTPSPSTPAKETRSKDGGPFATRNMFCSECTPPVATTPVNVDPSQIQTTSLPLVLLATMVSAKPEDSYATIVNNDTLKQGAYSIGDPVPGATCTGSDDKGNKTASSKRRISMIPRRPLRCSGSTRSSACKARSSTGSSSRSASHAHSVTRPSTTR